MSNATPANAIPEIESIARHALGIETLEPRGLDRLDFHDLSVASIRRALEAAYRAGLDARGRRCNSGAGLLQRSCGAMKSPSNEIDKPRLSRPHPSNRGVWRKTQGVPCTQAHSIGVSGLVRATQA